MAGTANVQSTSRPVVARYCHLHIYSSSLLDHLDTASKSPFAAPPDHTLRTCLAIVNVQSASRACLTPRCHSRPSCNPASTSSSSSSISHLQSPSPPPLSTSPALRPSRASITTRSHIRPPRFVVVKARSGNFAIDLTRKASKEAKFRLDHVAQAVYLNSNPRNSDVFKPILAE